MRRSKSVLFVESKRFQSQLSYRARKRDNELFHRCVRCPKTVEDAHACCQDCRAQMAAEKRAAVEQGLCMDFWAEPALPGKRYCATHDTKRKQRLAGQYTDRLIRHRCVRCGKKREKGRTALCEACATRDRTSRQKKRQCLDQIREEAVAAMS